MKIKFVVSETWRSELEIEGERDELEAKAEDEVSNGRYDSDNASFVGRNWNPVCWICGSDVDSVSDLVECNGCGICKRCARL